MSTLLVFVHGWSVTNTNTYGGLPDRLRNEAKAAGLGIEFRHVYLGRYISFHDEVTLADVARAFDAAVNDTLGTEIAAGKRFACITHSTGGPVVREWWSRYWSKQSASVECPMSHLIMLAPANFGSALAQIGKARLGRLKSWFNGVEPGTGVLDWLELGSRSAWALNTEWIRSGARKMINQGAYPFVLTGQTIDRKFYDHLNSYTGETGSDGVVRVAAANMNARYIRFEQEAPRTSKGKLVAPMLEPTEVKTSPTTAMRIVRGAAHSGSDKGIMRSVYRPENHPRGKDVTDSILQCLAVTDKEAYKALTADHAQQSTTVQKEEQIEVEERLLLRDPVFVHDRYSMVIFRITDDQDYPVNDFDLLITAGTEGDPNRLPSGFLVDRQQNRRSRNTVTLYFNYDVMIGTPEIRHDGRVIRDASDGAGCLGFRIDARPTDGFVHYLPCEAKADAEKLKQVLQPNQTTLIDIQLSRVVHKPVFEIDKTKTSPAETRDFKRIKPGKAVLD
ncbi:MAG: phospholipase [Pseudomonadota bacterium]